jgi:hypothetical protein
LVRVGRDSVHPGWEHRNGPVCLDWPFPDDVVGSFASSLPEDPALVAGLRDPMPGSISVDREDSAQLLVASMVALKPKLTSGGKNSAPHWLAMSLTSAGATGAGRAWARPGLLVKRGGCWSMEMLWRSNSRAAMGSWKAKERAGSIDDGLELGSESVGIPEGGSKSRGWWYCGGSLKQKPKSSSWKLSASPDPWELPRSSALNEPRDPPKSSTPPSPPGEKWFKQMDWSRGTACASSNGNSKDPDSVSKELSVQYCAKSCLCPASLQ